MYTVVYAGIKVYTGLNNLKTYTEKQNFVYGLISDNKAYKMNCCKKRIRYKINKILIF